MGKIDNWDDRIDSRDVLARIAELESDRDEWCAGAPAQDWAEQFVDEAEELDLLVKLVSDMRQIGGDAPEDGIVLVRESDWENYAQELHEETSEPSSLMGDWPYRHIDWEAAARELQMDYTSIDFDGVDYYVR